MSVLAFKHTRVYGKPGSYAAGLARDAFLRSVGWLACAAPLFGAVIWALKTSGGDRVMVVAACSGGIAATLMARNRFEKYMKAAVGVRSERRVAKELAKVGASAVIHGADMGRGGDCDHVVIGPQLVAVETKTGSGKVSVASNGQIRAGGRIIPKDPIGQVIRQADMLHRLAGVQVTPVIVICDMTNEPFQTYQGVTITSLKHLKAVVSRAPHVLSNSKADQVTETLLNGWKATR